MKKHVFEPTLFAFERKIAHEITEKTYNGPGTGYQYFRCIEGSKRFTNPEVCVLFAAFNFQEDDSYFLAGPFEHHNKYYGLVSVYYNTNAEPKDTLRAKFFAKSFKQESLAYLNYQARVRIEDNFGKGTEFYRVPGEGDQPYFSGLDLKFGKKDIPEDVLNKLEKSKDLCALFFKTPSALAEIIKLLTEQEILEWKESLKSNAEECWLEVESTATYVERPFKVHLQGTDDCSFEANFSTKQDVINFLKELPILGSAVVSKMTFTN